MNAALGLLIGSAIVGLYGHRSVSTVSRVALTAADHPTAGIFRLAGGCWTRPASGTVPGWREALAALGLVAAATILVRIAWVVVLRVRRRRRTSGHAAGLRLLAADVPSGEPLWGRASPDAPRWRSSRSRCRRSGMAGPPAQARPRRRAHPAETPDSGQIGGQPRRA